MDVAAGNGVLAGDPPCDRVAVGLPAEGDPVAAGGLAVDLHRAAHLCAVGIGLTAHDRGPVEEAVGSPQLLDRDVVEAGDGGQRLAAVGDVIGVVGGRAGEAGDRAAVDGNDQRAPDIGHIGVAEFEIDHGPLAFAVVGVCVRLEMGHLRDAAAGLVFDPEPPVPLAGAAAKHEVELAAGAGRGYDDGIAVGLPADGNPVAARGPAVDLHRAARLRAVGVGLAADDCRPVVEVVGCPQVLDRDAVERCNAGERVAGSDDVDVGDGRRLQAGCMRRLREESE